MAFSPKSSLLLLLCIFPLSLSYNPTFPSNPNQDLHDLLPSYNLPKGLIPNNVNSFTLSPKDSSFSVQLTHPCYVQFQDHLVYYEKEIKGKLSYGEVSDVSGIQAKKLFIWVPVTGINVDENSDMIEFHVGFLSEKLPAKEFDIIPTCKNNNNNKGCQDSLLASI